MGEPGKAPAGWYDDGAGSLRYWDGDSWTEHTSAREFVPPPLPPDSTPTLPESTPLGASSGWVPPASAQGEWATQASPVPSAVATTTVAATPRGVAPTAQRRRTSVIGIIALAIAVVGFVLVCIPVTMIAGLVLLPAAVVLAIVSLGLRGAEWSAVTALPLAILGLIVGVVVFIVNVAGTITEAVGEAPIPTVEAPQPTVDPEPESTAEPDEIEGPVKGDFPGMIAPTSPSVPFGQTIAWEDGVTMTVTPPETYVPTEFATGDGANNVVFTLTITNGSPDAISLLTYSQVTSAGQPGAIVFDVLDSGEEISAEPSGILEPGQSVTWREAWAVADPNAITLLDSPTVDHVEVTFTNEQ